PARGWRSRQAAEWRAWSSSHRGLDIAAAECRARVRALLHRPNITGWPRSGQVALPQVAGAPAAGRAGAAGRGPARVPPRRDPVLDAGVVTGLVEARRHPRIQARLGRDGVE